jgi:hypothetical protein
MNRKTYVCTRASPSLCTLGVSSCGNGIVEATDQGAEQCDLGLANGDEQCSVCTSDCNTGTICVECPPEGCLPTCREHLHALALRAVAPSRFRSFVHGEPPLDPDALVYVPRRGAKSTGRVATRAAAPDPLVQGVFARPQGSIRCAPESSNGVPQLSGVASECEPGDWI